MLERSWCHTASYTCAVAAIAALNGDDIGWLPDAVEEALHLEVEAPAQDKISSPGQAETGRRLRRQCSSCAKAPTSRRRRTRWSNCCTGISRRSTTRRARSCSKGRGRIAERAQDAVTALEKLGCETTLVPTVHPVVDIVRFHLLTLAVAEARGIDPDPIRREPGSRVGRCGRRAVPVLGV